MKRILYLALALGGFAGASFAAEEKPPASVPAQLFPDKLVARSKTWEIRQSQVDDQFLAFKSNRAAQGRAVPDEARPKIEADILDRLIATRLLLDRATAADRKQGEKTGRELIAGQKKAAPSEGSYRRQVAAGGLTLEQYEGQAIDRAVVETVIDRELKARQKVMDDDINKYYQANPKLFEEPESARVAHVMISTRDAEGRDLPEIKRTEKKKIAEKVLARARAGEDFAALAREFSDDDMSRERGGEYAITRERTATVLEFQAAAFSLATNQISDIVTTRFGFHVVKSLEKKPAQKIELVKAVEKIRETLLQEAAEKELPDFIEKLKKEAGVEILVPQPAK